MMQFDKTHSGIYTRLGHRGAFALTMMEISAGRDDLMLMTADLGLLTGLTRFRETYPDKFLNIGIAEANMIGIASGLAREGFLVYATTYSTFLSMRAYELIRIHLGYMQANVKVVGTGSGVAMGQSGNTHYGIEDLALMRAVPGLTVIAPADGMEICKAVLAAADHQGPVYIRLTGDMSSPAVYTDDYEFKIGKAVRLREGKDLTIFATGTMVFESLSAAKILAESGIEAAVIDVHTLKPLDTEAIDQACASTRLLVSVEEHSVVGGLGGAIAEHKATLATSPKQLFIGLPDRFGKVEDYRVLLEKYGLTAKQIAQQIMKAL